MERESYRRAMECASAFSEATGVGATVLSPRGEMIEGYGTCLITCPLCALAGASKDDCARTHVLGMGEAERFGGKYVYFCAMGLNCFTAPVVSDEREPLMITVGPFLMVDRADYIACEVDSLSLDDARRADFLRALGNVQSVPTERVQALSTMLSMAAGFLGNVYRANQLLSRQSANRMQGHISAYIQENKHLELPYPLETERGMLRAMSRRDRNTAQQLLNELLGHILLTGGTDFSRIVARVHELFVLMSRTAIENGADVEAILNQSHKHMQALRRIEDADALCNWLSGVMNEMIKSIFLFPQTQHAKQIMRAVEYIEGHYSEKLSLADVAGHVYLTAAYFGRMFKRETGTSFSDFLNRVRVDKSKEYLIDDALRLTDIAQMIGFEDQSYFTKVFKRLEGITPDRYRKRVKI